MDCFDLLAVQGILKNLLQYHSSKASVLQHSAFFIVQLSHLYMTTGKAIALTRQPFVGKVLSLLLNTPSMFVKVFLPRSKCLLILWFQSPSTAILEPWKINNLTVSIVCPSICHEVIGLDVMILIPGCATSSLVFCMMLSAYKLNKQGDNIQSWHTPFTVWTSLLFHVQFKWLLLDLHTGFSGEREGSLVFPFLEEFSTVCCDPHSQRC